MLYVLIFRPIRIHIDLHRQAEEEKDALVDELRKVIDEVKTLRGIIPVCASCKKSEMTKNFCSRLRVIWAIILMLCFPKVAVKNVQRNFIRISWLRISLRSD